MDDAVGFGNVLARIAQDRVVHPKRLGKRLVSLFSVNRIATCRKIGHVKFADFRAALTERLAFGRSATGEGFGEPRQDDRLLSFVIGELVRFAVAPWQFEVRRGIAGFQRFARGCGSCAAAQQGSQTNADAHGRQYFHDWSEVLGSIQF